jgi:hypothetical protein
METSTEEDMFKFSKAKRIIIYLTLYETVCLWFIKPKYYIDFNSNCKIKYKILKDKMYIIDEQFNALSK